MRSGLDIIPLSLVTSGSVELSAFDGRSGNPTSGPRFGYLLFAIGVTLIIAGLMRLRAKGLAEPGPNLALISLPSRSCSSCINDAARNYYFLLPKKWA